MAEIEEEPVPLDPVNDIILSIAESQNRISEMFKRLRDETEDSRHRASLIVWERGIKELEDSEKKLIDEFYQVMSNLYLLPGYVVAVSSGVSGLLSSDPHLCWLLSNVIVIVIIFLAALWLAVHVAYRHLLRLQAKMGELVAERTSLYRSFLDQRDSFPESILTTNPVLKKLKNYESKNSDLEFQAHHYGKILLLITVGGLLYAFMLLIAAYYVLCGGQSNKRFPCTLPTPPCLHSAVPLEPVPDHLPFSPCVPSLRPYQDM